MKLTKRCGLSTTNTLVLSKEDAFCLIAVISDSLYRNRNRRGRIEMRLENGQAFDVEIDFDKEKEDV